MFNLFYEAENELWQIYKDRINLIWDSLEKGILPGPEHRACVSVKDKKAKDCPFKDRCFLAEEGDELK